MAGELRIRELRREDYDALLALWEVAGLPSRTAGRDGRDAIDRQLRLPTAVYLAAEIDGRLVGSILATHDGRKGWINRLAVLPAERRRGIARRLVDEAERRLREHGIHIVACLIEGWNTQSLDVFAKLGYEAFDGMHYLTKRDDPRA